ncbi:MAG: hypothetical protein HY816_23470 [Candidatus Wallbacteria bacterium]|nr:hypothetical protein [Candidatus Wallbacteria bacterium]
MSHRHPTRSRRGTTLVEVLIMSLVALVLATVMWFLFSGGMRHFRSTDTKLKGVQGAQLLVEHLQDDFDRICWDPGHPLTGAGQEGPESLLTVSFWVYDKKYVPDKLQPTPIVSKVTYKWDPDSRKIFRNDKAMPFSRFEQVRFKFQPANAKDPYRPQGEKAPPPNSLLYWISSASDERLATLDQQSDSKEPSEKADRRGITTLFGAIHLTGKVAADQFPGWQENPPDVAVSNE